MKRCEKPIYLTSSGNIGFLTLTSELPPSQQRPRSVKETPRPHLSALIFSRVGITSLRWAADTSSFLVTQSLSQNQGRKSQKGRKGLRDGDAPPLLLPWRIDPLRAPLQVEGASFHGTVFFG